MYTTSSGLDIEAAQTTGSNITSAPMYSNARACKNNLTAEVSASRIVTFDDIVNSDWSELHWVWEPILRLHVSIAELDWSGLVGFPAERPSFFSSIFECLSPKTH